MQQDILIENRGFSDINPLICGHQDCTPGHSYGPFIREYVLIHYIIKGKGEFFTPRGTHCVTEGQLFVIHPGEVTTYTADAHDPWHYVWIGFTTSIDLGFVLSDDVITAPECSHIFRSLMESGSITHRREWYICGKLYEFISLLSNERPLSEIRPIHYVRMAQNYIESNYERELRVDRLAESLNLDRSYFSKLFKTHTGKSPQKYIVDFRLEKAAELLALHKLTAGEAAKLCGYTDIFNFSRMFKRRFGVSPSKYNGLKHSTKLVQ